MGSVGPGKRNVTDADISKLKELLSGTNAHVRGPSDPDYTKSIDRWSKAAEKQAGVAIVPTSAEEVSVAVKYAAEQGLDLAVKGGGHSVSLHTFCHYNINVTSTLRNLDQCSMA
jgi:FAD/FMN-containing dehydrogenase